MTQETLIRLVKKVESKEFDIKKGSLQMYAFGIAHFVRLEFCKHPTHLYIESPADSAEDSTLDENLEIQQRAKLLRKALLRLPATQQNILSLVIDKELTNNEIGMILNIPTGTVKSHVHRAKSSLKLELEKDLGGPHV